MNGCRNETSTFHRLRPAGLEHLDHQARIASWGGRARREPPNPEPARRIARRGSGCGSQRALKTMSMGRAYHYFSSYDERPLLSIQPSPPGAPHGHGGLTSCMLPTGSESPKVLIAEIRLWFLWHRYDLLGGRFMPNLVQLTNG